MALYAIMSSAIVANILLFIIWSLFNYRPMLFVLLEGIDGLDIEGDDIDGDENDGLDIDGDENDELRVGDE